VGGWCPPYASASVVHPHCPLEIVVGVQVVVGIGALASDATINGKAEDSGSDRRPLGFGQGDGQGVQGKDVGADGHQVSVAVESIVAGRGWGSTLPVIGGGQCPDQRFKVGGVDVLCPVMGDLPDLAGRVRNPFDALHTVGGKHHHRFGDQHRSGSVELRSV